MDHFFSLLLTSAWLLLYSGGAATAAAPAASQPIIAQSPENGSGGLAGAEPTGPAQPPPRDVAGHPDLTGYWKPLREKGKPGGNLGKDLPGFQLPLTASGKAAQEYNRTKTIDPEALCILGGIPRHDASGLPFVGKAGQLLNNMIKAMGLQREEVYIANIIKCRPPGNRTPEPIEANTCSPFLLRQIDIVRPQVIVALGGTAATYLLGVKQSLSSLRGHWYSTRGAKLAVTYHPAFLLRDPRQKGEAWKDLQMVMEELGLKPAAKA